MPKLVGPKKSGQAHPQQMEFAEMGVIADAPPTVAGQPMQLVLNKVTPGQRQALLFEIAPERLERLLAIRERINGDHSATQRARLLDALRALGQVSTFEAMRYLDIFDPRPRKLELIREGHQIRTIRHYVLTESGRRHRIGVYSLVSKPTSSNVVGLG